MISHEWTTGNKCGNYVAPIYNAISYTWGPYDLQYMPNISNDVDRTTRSIDVAGIPCVAEVPRIHADHFSSTDLPYIIDQSLRLSPTINTEFVWLDVACIDQRDGPQKKAEIGRQASIFKDPESVFVLLTRHRVLTLEKTLGCLADWASKFFPAYWFYRPHSKAAEKG